VSDPSDTATYYVRAVVRDSVSGAILATLDLEDKTGQRFAYNYVAPADRSGQGKYIDVTTTVYSDAGYTTRTGIYADENETYLVKSDTQLGGGFGMGEGVSYKEIRKIIKEELEKIEMPEMPEMKEAKDLTPEMQAMETRIMGRIDAIEIPRPERVDLNPILAGLDEITNTLLVAIDNKEVTPETDLNPVLEMVQQLPIQELMDVYQQAKEMTDTLNAVVENQAELDQLRTAAEQFVNSTKTKKLPQPKQGNPTLDRARRLLGNPQMA
jgi:hypothetical protein